MRVRVCARACVRVCVRACVLRALRGNGKKEKQNKKPGRFTTWSWSWVSGSSVQGTSRRGRPSCRLPCKPKHMLPRAQGGSRLPARTRTRASVHWVPCTTHVKTRAAGIWRTLGQFYKMESCERRGPRWHTAEEMLITLCVWARCTKGKSACAKSERCKGAVSSTKVVTFHRKCVCFE